MSVDNSPEQWVRELILGRLSGDLRRETTARRWLAELGCSSLKFGDELQSNELTKTVRGHDGQQMTEAPVFQNVHSILGELHETSSLASLKGGIQ